MSKQTATIQDFDAFKADFEALIDLERKHAERTAKLENKITALRAKHETETAASRADIAALRETISQYAQAHKAELLTGKAKSVSLGQGSLKWRKLPDSVQVSSSLNEVLATLKSRRLSRFIRTKEELNKTLLLAEADYLHRRPIDGLAIIKGGEVLTVDTGVKL